MKTISLKLPEVLDARLSALAVRRGGSGKSELIREAIEQFLKQENGSNADSVLDGMLDLVGKFDGPADLSTDPAYLEDLGSGSLRYRRHRSNRRRAKPR